MRASTPDPTPGVGPPTQTPRSDHPSERGVFFFSGPVVFHLLGAPLLLMENSV
jgi:hypothetical protein